VRQQSSNRSHATGMPVAVNAESTGAKAELRRSFVLRVGAAAAGTISTFLLTVIVVRTLDARDTAAFFAILAALPIGSIVGRLGLGQNVVRLIPAEPTVEGRRIVAGTHLQATVVLTLPTAPLIAVCATVGLIGHGDFPTALLLTSAMIMLEAVRTMLSDIFAALGRVTAAVATMHYFRSAAVLPVVGIVAYGIEDPTLLNLLTAYTVVAAIQVVVSLGFARRDLAIRFSGVFSSLRRAIADGSRLFAFEVTAFLIISGSIWLASATFPPETAAHYSAAMTIATQVTLFEGLAALAVMPPAARLWAAGRKREVVRLLSDLSTVNTVITIAVVAGLAAFGTIALEFAYGPSMRDAGVLLVILAAGGIPQAALSVAASLLIISGEIDAVGRTALLVLVVVVPSAVAAAFFGGALTLAIVAALGLATLYVALWFTARRHLESAPFPHWRVIRAVRELISETTHRSEDDTETDSTTAAV
jgi:O-antigen/teichoic acid export membrane protein